MPRKSKDKAISLAASIMGKKGGSMRTEKQQNARSVNLRKARSVLALLPDKERQELRRAAQLTIPEADRKARAAAAVKARWAKRDAEAGHGMDHAEFRRLTDGMTAQEIADAVGVTYSKVVSWRRRSNPVKIGAEDAGRIRAWAGKHADLQTEKC